MRTHALLAPSSASRWLACTPSARLEEKFPDKAGQAAQEGTLAHALGELLIFRKQKIVSKAVFEKELKGIQENALYDAAMLEYCEQYAVYILEQYNAAKAHTKDAQIFLEQKLDMTDYVPEGYGTGDVVIIADGVMDMIDLKYGKGVPVSAVENRQMMLYALGALREFDFLYDIQTVRMTIYQPRLDTISVWEISVNELRQWAEVELKPRAAMAFEGKGEYAPGTHCRFCKAKAVCKANADKNLEIAQYEFKDNALLSDEDITDILNRAEQFSQWLSGVQEHAFNEALNGKKWPGWKLVEGRSNRRYADQSAVADKLIKEGFKEETIYKPKELLTITAMEKAITKKVFDATLSDLIIKPPGKPALVPESDKRPELNSVASAIEDFS